MDKQPLSLSDIHEAAEAADQFIADHGDCGLQYEIIMLFCFIKENSQPAQQMPSRQSKEQKATVAGDAGVIPEWFVDGVKKFAGRKMTASSVLSALGKPTDIKSLRIAGGWLRKLYGEPARSKGQTLFSIFSRNTGAEAHTELMAEHLDMQSAFEEGIPIATKALNFAAIKQAGRYKPDEIARLIGHQGTPQETVEIGRALSQHGFQYGQDGYFDLSPQT